MSATARSTGGMRAQRRDHGRVLLITDEESTRGYADVLEAAGLSVVGVEGGAAALVALQRTRPHAVVADVRMKGISAVELARALGRAEEFMPVVFVGAQVSDTETRGAALNAGAFDYFQLPTETALLIERLNQLIKMRLLIDRLRSEADRDSLTGLANRRRFRRALEQEVERWRRYHIPCTLLLVDIDHMKRINDTHGHPAGDTVICAVASALSDLSRDNDTAARLGGEEFALLLAGVEGEKGETAAERLRAAVASSPVEDVGEVTISVGVAACPEHARTERQLFSASDAALYNAKHSGRNRVEVARAESV